MTYSIDYRKQVLSSIDNCLTIRDAAAFYELSTSTIHSWRQTLEPMKGRDKALTRACHQLASLYQDKLYSLHT